MKLNPKRKYLQIAFNRPLAEVKSMIALLPPSETILIEVGTPLIKHRGVSCIASVSSAWESVLGKSGYIVADLKCMDRGSREVEAAATAGASAATCLGLAPTETIHEFIVKCAESGIDSMVDMMNVTFPFEVLQKLRVLPTVVVLHRSADEVEHESVRQIPHDQIRRIKATYGNVLVSIAGGETHRDVARTYFNDADIAVVWKSLYDEPLNSGAIARDLLTLVK